MAYRDAEGMYTAGVMEDKLMKCVDCDLKKLQERKCGGNRYYCGHPDAPRKNGPALICKTERHSTELMIKTSPRWCPLRNRSVEV